MVVGHAKLADDLMIFYCITSFYLLTKSCLSLVTELKVKSYKAKRKTAWFMSFAVPARKNGIADVYWNFKVQKNGVKILLITKMKVLLQPSECMWV